jgi:hypothetical protein
MVVKLQAAPVPGFNNQSLIHIANKPWVTLLDGGATCSSIPEEMLEEIFNLTAVGVERGNYTWGSPECPIKCFEDFAGDPRTIEGLAKDKPIIVTHSVILRVKFVPIGASVGPMRAIRMKVLPRGASSFPGIILAAPTLAPAPGGLGLRTEPHAHVLQTLGVCLPRLEEEVEARFRKESVNVAFVVDSAAQIHLSPGAVALVPVRASRLFSGEVQAQDFPGSAVSLAAFGPVEGVESMLFLTNRSGLDVEL